MSQLSKVLRDTEGNGLVFQCPGCSERHRIVHGEGRWTWNGDVEKPTFSPSVLVRGGHYSDLHKPGDDCWCTYYAEHPDEEPRLKCGICHSFVTNWQIQFLGDCTHALAGQTVDLPQLPNQGRQIHHWLVY